MNAYKQIQTLKTLLPENEAAIFQAEKVLWDTFVATFRTVNAQDFMDTLDDKPVRKTKENPPFQPAMEALEELRKLGKKVGINFALLTTEADFIKWLLHDYALNAMMRN